MEPTIVRDLYHLQVCAWSATLETKAVRSEPQMPTITIYPITGRQLGPLRVPHRWCEECELTVRRVRDVVAELGAADVRVEAKP